MMKFILSNVFLNYINLRCLLIIKEKSSLITISLRMRSEGNHILSLNLIIIRGSFAIVKSAVNKKTGEKVAVKIIER